MTRPSLFQTKVLRGDAEAVELLVGFPVPYGDEEGQGVPARGSGPWARSSISELSGFPGLAGYSS